MEENLKGRKLFKKIDRARTNLKNQAIELELFVSGITPRSIRAIEILKDICKTHLEDRHTLKVIDIYREPQLAKENEVFAVPTLIRRNPGPKKIFIGDLSNTAPVLKALGIKSGDTK
jgi:circadian clock protein KaiB